MTKKNKNLNVVKKGDPQHLSGSRPDLNLDISRPRPNRGFDALVDELLGSAVSRPPTLNSDSVAVTLPSSPVEAVLASPHTNLPHFTHQTYQESPRQQGSPPERRLRRTEASLIAPSDPPPGVSAFASYPLYFYLNSTTSRPLTSSSHLVLSEALEEVLRSHEVQATPMRNGSILVRAASRAQSQVLSSLSRLGNISVISTPDDVRNTSKGTIYAQEFRSESTDDILAHLQRRNLPITNVYRFPPHRDNPSVPNPRLLLTFSVPFPPSRVKLGFNMYTIRTYIPFPRRCFKCHKFGHPQKYCRSPHVVCSQCGSSLHATCANPACCPNCKGPHSASSVHCPFFKLEKEILEQCALHKLDRREATRLAKEKLSHLPLSFAQATARSSGFPPRPRVSSEPVPPNVPSPVPPQVPAFDTPVMDTSVLPASSSPRLSCPPASPTSTRVLPRRRSPEQTTLSHGVCLVDVHAALSSPPSRPLIDSPSLESLSSTSTARDISSGPRGKRTSRKRSAPVSPGGSSGRSPARRASHDDGSSPPRQYYSLHHTASDFLKSSTSDTPAVSSKRARRSPRSRNRGLATAPSTPSRDSVDTVLVSGRSLSSYSSDSESCPDSCMNVTIHSCSSDPSPSKDQEVAHGDASVPVTAVSVSHPASCALPSMVMPVPPKDSLSPSPNFAAPLSPTSGVTVGEAGCLGAEDPPLTVTVGPDLSPSVPPVDSSRLVASTVEEVDSSLTRLFDDDSVEAAGSASQMPPRSRPISILRDLPLPPGFEAPPGGRRQPSGSRRERDVLPPKDQRPITTIVTDRSVD